MTSVNTVPADAVTEAAVTELIHLIDAPGANDTAADTAAAPPPAACDPALDEDLRVACGKPRRGKVVPNAGALAGLVSRGASLRARDADGWTALFYAASGDGLVEELRFLLAHATQPPPPDGQVNGGGSEGNDGCIAAGGGGDGVDLDAVDDDGCTALWNACYNNQRQAAVLLMSRGASLDLKGTEAGGLSKVPIGPAMAARRNNNPGLADLVDAEARLRAADETRTGRLRQGDVDEADFIISLKAEEANKVM